MADPQSKPILLDPRGRPIPQGWDQSLDGSEGNWRALTIADFGGSAPLSAPSSNIPRTPAPTGAPDAVLAGACVYGFHLRNDGPGDLYYGTSAVDVDEGDLLEPGERAWIPVTDSSAIFVKGSLADTTYRGVRY